MAEISKTVVTVHIGLRQVPTDAPGIFCHVSEIRPSTVVDCGRTEFSPPDVDIEFSTTLRINRFHGKKQTFKFDVYAADSNQVELTSAKLLGTMTVLYKGLLQGFPDSPEFGAFPPLFQRLGTADGGVSDMSIMVSGISSSSRLAALGEVELGFEVRGVPGREGGGMPNPFLLLLRSAGPDELEPAITTAPGRGVTSGALPSFRIPLGALVDLSTVASLPGTPAVPKEQVLLAAATTGTRLRAEIMDWTDDSGGEALTSEVLGGVDFTMADLAEAAMSGQPVELACDTEGMSVVIAKVQPVADAVPQTPKGKSSAPPRKTSATSSASSTASLGSSEAATAGTELPTKPKGPPGAKGAPPGASKPANSAPPAKKGPPPGTAASKPEPTPSPAPAPTKPAGIAGARGAPHGGSKPPGAAKGAPPKPGQAAAAAGVASADSTHTVDSTAAETAAAAAGEPAPESTENTTQSAPGGGDVAPTVTDESAVQPTEAGVGAPVQQPTTSLAAANAPEPGAGPVPEAAAEGSSNATQAAQRTDEAAAPAPQPAAAEDSAVVQAPQPASAKAEDGQKAEGPSGGTSTGGDSSGPSTAAAAPVAPAAQVEPAVVPTAGAADSASAPPGPSAAGEGAPVKDKGKAGQPTVAEHSTASAPAAIDATVSAAQQAATGSTDSIAPVTAQPSAASESIPAPASGASDTRPGAEGKGNRAKTETAGGTASSEPSAAAATSSGDRDTGMLRKVSAAVAEAAPLAASPGPVVKPSPQAAAKPIGTGLSDESKVGPTPGKLQLSGAFGHKAGASPLGGATSRTASPAGGKGTTSTAAGGKVVPATGAASAFAKPTAPAASASTSISTTADAKAVFGGGLRKSSPPAPATNAAGTTGQVTAGAGAVKAAAAFRSTTTAASAAPRKSPPASTVASTTVAAATGMAASPVEPKAGGQAPPGTAAAPAPAVALNDSGLARGPSGKVSGPGGMPGSEGPQILSMASGPSSMPATCKPSPEAVNTTEAHAVTVTVTGLDQLDMPERQPAAEAPAPAPAPAAPPVGNAASLKQRLSAKLGEDKGHNSAGPTAGGQAPFAPAPSSSPSAEAELALQLMGALGVDTAQVAGLAPQQQVMVAKLLLQQRTSMLAAQPVVAPAPAAPSPASGPSVSFATWRPVDNSDLLASARVTGQARASKAKAGQQASPATPAQPTAERTPAREALNAALGLDPFSLKTVAATPTTTGAAVEPGPVLQGAVQQQGQGEDVATQGPSVNVGPSPPPITSPSRQGSSNKTPYSVSDLAAAHGRLTSAMKARDGALALGDPAATLHAAQLVETAAADVIAALGDRHREALASAQDTLTRVRSLKLIALQEEERAVRDMGWAQGQGAPVVMDAAPEPAHVPRTGLLSGLGLTVGGMQPGSLATSLEQLKVAGVLPAGKAGQYGPGAIAKAQTSPAKRVDTPPMHPPAIASASSAPVSSYGPADYLAASVRGTLVLVDHDLKASMHDTAVAMQASSKGQATAVPSDVGHAFSDAASAVHMTTALALADPSTGPSVPVILGQQPARQDEDSGNVYESIPSLTWAEVARRLGLDGTSTDDDGEADQDFIKDRYGGMVPQTARTAVLKAAVPPLFVAGACASLGSHMCRLVGEAQDVLLSHLRADVYGLRSALAADEPEADLMAGPKGSEYAQVLASTPDEQLRDAASAASAALLDMKARSTSAMDAVVGTHAALAAQKAADAAYLSAASSLVADHVEMAAKELEDTRAAGGVLASAIPNRRMAVAQAQAQAGSARVETDKAIAVLQADKARTEEQLLDLARDIAVMEGVDLDEASLGALGMGSISGHEGRAAVHYAGMEATAVSHRKPVGVAELHAIAAQEAEDSAALLSDHQGVGSQTDGTYHTRTTASRARDRRLAAAISKACRDEAALVAARYSHMARALEEDVQSSLASIRDEGQTRYMALVAGGETAWRTETLRARPVEEGMQHADQALNQLTLALAGEDGARRAYEYWQAKVSTAQAQAERLQHAIRTADDRLAGLLESMAGARRLSELKLCVHGMWRMLERPELPSPRDAQAMEDLGWGNPLPQAMEAAPGVSHTERLWFLRNTILAAPYSPALHERLARMRSLLGMKMYAVPSPGRGLIDKPTSTSPKPASPRPGGLVRPGVYEVQVPVEHGHEAYETHGRAKSAGRVRERLDAPVSSTGPGNGPAQASISQVMGHGGPLSPSYVAYSSLRMEQGTRVGALGPLPAYGGGSNKASSAGAGQARSLIPTAASARSVVQRLQKQLQEQVSGSSSPSLNPDAAQLAQRGAVKSALASYQHVTGPRLGQQAGASSQHARSLLASMGGYVP